MVGVRDGFSGNFSRKVRVTARANSSSGLAETVDGTVMRVRMGSMRKEEMGIPASLGVNLQGDATVEVAIENGDDGALPISFVTLEMRERSICFQVPSGVETATLFYGDGELSAPVYEGSGVSSAGGVAMLGPEVANPGFVTRVDRRGFLARHPELLWVGLLAGVGLAGTVGLRISRRVGA